MEENLKKVNIEKQENSKVDFKYMLFLLKKGWKVILAFSVVAVIAAVVYIQYFTVPLYSSASMLFVYRNNDSPNSLYSEINAGAQLVKDVAAIIKSGSIAEQAYVHMGSPKDLTPGVLARKVNASVEKDTRLVTIKVTDRNPDRAARIANSVSDVLIDKFDDIMKTNKASNNEFVSTVEKAKPNLLPVSPNKPVIIAYGFILGFLLGIGVVLLLEYLDNTVKSPEEAEIYADCCVLAIVPVFLKQ